MSTNLVILVGRLGADPELRYTQNQKPCTTLSVATSEYGKDNVEVTTWHRVIVWGKSAETCAQSLKKGSEVFVEGTLKNNKWTGSDGVARNQTEVHTFRVKHLDASPQVSPQPEFEITPRESPPVVKPLSTPDLQFDINTDKIPF